MAPIRVGIIGLSAKQGAWASIAHLPRLRASPNYEIFGLCNSSVESTKAAIKAHDLASSTRVYSSPKELVADPDIDLVVISTRVDTHYGLAKTALEASKSVYVEWPLGSNADQARELVSLAKDKGVKTIVGLQGRKEPAIVKAKEIVESGRLGTVHSVNVQSATGVWQKAASERYSYFLDKTVGGNVLTIYGGHTFDTVLFVHGELKKGYTTVLGNLRPEVHILDEQGKISEKSYPKNTPDQILVQGRFDTATAPVLTFHQRAGNKFTGKNGLTWAVYGDKAEMLIEIEGGSPHIGSPTKISICDGETGEVEEIVVDQSFEGLNIPAANIGRLYEAYAAGDRNGYADWEHALKRHEWIDEAYASNDM